MNLRKLDQGYLALKLTKATRHFREAFLHALVILVVISQLLIYICIYDRYNRGEEYD